MQQVTRRVLAGVLLLWCGVVIAGCGESSSGVTGGGVASGGGLQGKLTISGSSTVAPLVLEVGKRFEEMHKGVRVDVQTGGSSRGLADVRAGLADIGMVSRGLKAGEEDVTGWVVAHDGIGLIVHADNPVSSLTQDEVRGIYNSTLRRWSQVGGPDEPITVVNKAEGRSTLELFCQHFKIEAKDIRADVVIGDNQQGVKQVAGSPWAIGYVSVGSAESAAQQGDAVRLVALDGIEALTQALREGRHPVSRPLTLVTAASAAAAGEAPVLARAFVEFAQSSACDDLVKGQFFVPIER